MMALPTKRNTLPKSESSLWLIPSLYSDELPMPHMKIPLVNSAMGKGKMCIVIQADSVHDNQIAASPLCLYMMMLS